MPTTLGTIPKPIRKDKYGVLRVGNTRIMLDLVVQAFNEGKTAAEIQRNYDTLSLAEVHGAISYYLHNKEQVDEYLIEQAAEFERLRDEHEARFPPKLNWNTLMARKNGTDPSLPK